MTPSGWICILTSLILQTTGVWTQDCSSNLRNISQKVTIKETDPNGTLITEFENLNVKVDWSASVNGSYSNVISGYLYHEVDDRYFRLFLSKTVDLEFISTDLNMNIGDDGLEIKIVLRCREISAEATQVFVDLAVRPVNEFFPAFLRAPYEINVKENTPVGKQVFTFQDRVIDMDVGRHIFSFRITPYMIYEFDGRRLFEINGATGDIVVAAELDFEQLPRFGRNYYFLNVTVRDEGGFAQSTSVKVTLEDVNDLSIKFVYPGCSLSSCDSVNVSYSAQTNESYLGIIDVSPVPIRAEDLDSLQERIEYFLLTEPAAEYFQIDRYTGDLCKTALLVNDSFSFEIDLQILIREETDASHNLTTYVKLVITERIPTTGIKFYLYFIFLELFLAFQ